MKRYVIILLAILLGWSWAGSASAHANLVSSVPAANAVVATAPPTVQLRFSEPLEAASSAAVVDHQGRRVDNHDSHRDPADSNGLVLSLPSLPEGVYTVQWTSLSAADGHSTTGSFAFAVGSATGLAAPLILPPFTPDPLALPPLTNALLRWLTLLALTITGGALAFGTFVRPGLPAASERPFNRWQRSTLAIGTVLGLAATLASLWQALPAGGLATLLTSRGATLLSLRLGLWVVVAALGWWSAMRPPRLWIALGAWAALAATVSLFGHAAVAAPGIGGALLRAITVILDWTHLAATALWIGGLLQLAGCFVALRHLPPDERPGVLAPTIARFSALAFASVLVLTGSGLWSTWRHMAAIEELWTTTYGRSLLIKLGLFGLLIVLGAINRQLTPRLGRAMGAAVHDLLRRTTTIELGLGLLVLVLAGSLTSSPPGRDLPPATGYTQRATVSGHHLTLQVQPISTGQYVVALTVDPVTPGQTTRALLRTSMLAHQMAASEVELQQVEPGRWGTRGSFLSMTGTWQWEVIVRTPGADDIRTLFNVDSQQVDAFSRPTITLAQRLSLPLWMIAAMVLLLLTVVTGLVALTRAAGPRRRRTVWGAQALGLAAFLMCVVPYYLGQLFTPHNPYQPTAEVLAQGKQVYSRNCVPCHGVNGQGDGPAARTLPIPPANFTLPHYTTHSQEQIYTWVTGGIAGRGMPAFGQRLTKEEIWQVITYINQLNQGAAAGSGNTLP